MLLLLIRNCVATISHVMATSDTIITKCTRYVSKLLLQLTGSEKTQFARVKSLPAVQRWAGELGVPGTTSVVVTVVHGVSTGAVSRCVLASGRIVLIGSIVVAGCALCGRYVSVRLTGRKGSSGGTSGIWQ
jgi:hypothetical protein